MYKIVGIYLGLFIFIWIVFKLTKLKEQPLRRLSFWLTSLISLIALTIIFIYLFLRAFGGKPLEDGWSRTHFEIGKIKTEFFVENGKLEGNYKTWYINGQLEFLSTYIRGELVDTSFCFFENGQINFLEVYMEGKIVYKANYYQNGQLESVTYSPISRNKYNYRIDYYPNGNKRFETEISNSTFEGNGFYYFSNGDIEYKGVYKQGQKDSVWVKLDSVSGEIIDRDTFNYNLPSRFKESWR